MANANLQIYYSNLLVDGYILAGLIRPTEKNFRNAFAKDAIPAAGGTGRGSGTVCCNLRNGAASA